MDLDYLTRGVRSLGLLTSLATIKYSWIRSRLDRRYLEEVTGRKTTPGRLLRHTKFPGGANFLFQAAELEILFLTANVVRITWRPGLEPPPYSLAETDQPPPPVELVQQDKDWHLVSSELRLVISPTGGLTYQNAQGETLRQETPPVRRGESWKLQSQLAEREMICGLGERAGSLNLRPGNYRFWNSDPGGAYTPDHDPLYLCIPLYQSFQTKGSYLVFYENPHDGRIELNEAANIEFSRGQLRSIFILGGPRETLRQLADLLGRPAMPPRWALGYHHSRWGYQNTGQVLSVIRNFADHNLPLDVLHLDIDYMKGFRVFTQDPERFPDLQPIADELDEKLGAKLVVILDPGVKIDPGYPVYRDGLQAGAFCQLPDGRPMAGVVWPGWVHFPDFSDPAARAWWGEKYQALLDQGVDGFWHDMNEPTSFAAWGEMTFPLSTRHAIEGQGGDHRSIHNIYGLLMDRAAYEGLRELKPEQRPWLLSRSGWAGLSRYAWHWTGDTESSWDMLASTISTVIGLGLSGIPFSGPDIGGFSGDPSSELYSRWFQAACFLPFFRNHSSKLSPPREPWTFDQTTMAILRKHLKLRQSFLPYFYTLAEEAHRLGWPMVRPLLWLSPEDASSREIDDCFLLGDHMLVAPVLEPEMQKRKVQLPAGTWTDYWTDERHTGPGEVTIPAPMDRVPLLIRAGAVIPRMEKSGLVLDLFAPAATGSGQESSLYLDEGDGYGPSRHDRFYSRPSDLGWSVEWKSQGSLPFPYPQIELQFHPPLPEEIELDGHSLKLQGGRATVAPFQQLTCRNRESS